MIERLLNNFFNWYEKHKTFHTVLAATLFTLQLIHLYWLSADVVAQRLIGESFFPISGIWQLLLILVDYTEIPAILTTSLLYINELRKKFEWKNIFYLIFINSQWLHIFWITDEFVIEQFSGVSTESILPFWLAWLAISIDYLELPVIFDTLKRTFKLLKLRGV